MSQFVDEQRDRFGVEPVCRVLGVAVSTNYARRKRKPCRRELRDRELVGEIHAARAGYRRVYGVRRPGRSSGGAASGSAATASPG